VINHHYRRYRRRDLLSVAEKAGLVLERHSHFNALLLPPAVVVRLAGRLRPRARRRVRRSELFLTPRVFNPLLELPLRVEAGLLRCGLKLPLGLSLLATYARPVESGVPAAEHRRRPARGRRLTSGSSTRS
jgi:hypothetical protein